MSEQTFPWVQTLRRESGLVEHVCKHGVGHPAVGSVMWMNAVTPPETSGTWGVHGCDGCCHSPEWRLADAHEGLRIATGLLVKAERRLRERR